MYLFKVAIQMTWRDVRALMYIKQCFGELPRNVVIATVNLASQYVR